MAGLMPKPMAEMAPEDDMDDPMPDDAVEASPEEQAIYDRGIDLASRMIYDKAMMPQLLGMMDDEDPKQGLADASVAIFRRVIDAAEQAGQEIPQDVKLHMGKDIVELVAELATEAGVYDFSADPDALEGAFFLALDTYRVQEQEAGTLDTEALSADFAQLEQADQDGRLKGELEQLAAVPAGKAKAAPEPKGKPAKADKPMPMEE